MKTIVIFFGLLFMSICCSLVIVGLGQIYSNEFDTTVGEAEAISAFEFLSTTTEEETTTQHVTNPNYLGWFWCTSYCSCPICCQQYAYNRPTDENGNEIVVGASGMVLEPGRSVAVDPSIIAYGTVLIIDGQEYVAADTGIKGYRLDFYYSSHEEALSHANHWCEVYVK